MYREGLGVPRDYGEAVRWYRKAAEQGVPQAQRALDSMGAGSNTRRRILYVYLSIMFLVSLCLSISFLLPGKSLQDWRQKAMTLLGISGMSVAGLSLYGIAHTEMGHPMCSNARYPALAGPVIVIAFVAYITARSRKRARP
jgi:TPR repeat protein